MKKKNLAALLLACVMTASAFTACGGPEENTDGASQDSAQSSAQETASGSQTASPEEITLPLFEETTTMSMFWTWNAAASKVMKDFSENHVWQEMEKRTNVKLEFVSPPLGQGQEQFNLIMASGDYPDFIWSDAIAYPGGGDKAIADGNYLKLNDYVDQYAPNYTKLINSTDTIRKQAYTDEGNIWGFAMIEEKVQGAWLGMVVRQDWLDDLGLDSPVTFDDWEDMLTKFKEEKGCQYPLALSSTGTYPDCNSMSAGFDVGVQFYQVDGEVKYGPIEEGYKEYLMLMNDWYQKGLIDPDFASRDGTQTENFIVTGQYGAWRDGFYMLDVYIDKAQDPNFALTAVPTPVKNEGDTAHLRQTNYNVRNLYMSISTNCEHPVEAVKFLDYLYSDEGFILCNYGIEGEGFTYVNDEPQFTDVVANNPDYGTDVALQLYALQGGPFNRVWDREMFTYGEAAQACEAIWDQADTAYVLPQITMTAEEGDQYAMLMGDINTLVAEKTVKYITGDESFDTYDAFVEQVKSMGIEQVIEIQQNALDRYNAR